ncbi:MAG: 16S rRNA (guanine(527)-N(7))-methyltransferase RsmG [Desulfobacterales bacterium]|nr:16S rRNA (guanine(527)-N(7))-methyltransferase RsmG [Desulfobacterales bacterium]
MNIDIEKEKVDQLAIYALELSRWNQKVNLTAITDPVEIAVKHFLDSIAPEPFIPPSALMLDIGSGSGFPGIPLKILLPSLSVTLIDASRKKASFLSHIIRNLKLQDIQAFHMRAEDLARKRALVKGYDVIICRALSSLKTFIVMASPLLAKDGMIVALKGNDVKKEIASLSLLTDGKSCQLKIGNYKFFLELKAYTLPHLELERYLVILKLITS